MSGGCGNVLGTRASEHAGPEVVGKPSGSIALSGAEHWDTRYSGRRRPSQCAMKFSGAPDGLRQNGPLMLELPTSIPIAGEPIEPDP